MNKRSRIIKEAQKGNGPVIYWMSRDQRIHDNWALISAMEYAVEINKPLVIIFNLTGNFLNAGSRQFRFLIRGLKNVFQSASEYNIPFFLLEGEASENIPEFIKKTNAAVLFSDFDPLIIKRQWVKEVAGKINIPVYETDAHNIVPAFIVSGKQEFSAMHFRRKIFSLLPEFSEEYPSVYKLKKSEFNDVAEPDFDALIEKYIKPPYEVDWIEPGQSAAYKSMETFLEENIINYSKKNDPNSKAVSDLSPYLHYGHLSAQRIFLNLQKMNVSGEAVKSFLDELIVRRELSDNYCLYNAGYNSFEGFPDWGKETLNKHRNDEREFLYSASDFENAGTHDNLWNAAQLEMMRRGKMHGYMRMYWAKKILEWSESPEDAQSIAIYLNDKYELDGRDPNGYAGIAWSIGGLHDRPFAERPVFGRIRFMNYNGCRRKFNIEEYISSV
jgi:deoxyribodipyrimidine photo-lyase